MNKVQRSVMIAIRPVVESHGAEVDLISDRGHNALVITLHGITRKVPFSSSPKDRDTMVPNVVRQVKSTLAILRVDNVNA